jgi:hypothetical protein
LDFEVVVVGGGMSAVAIRKHGVLVIYMQKFIYNPPKQFTFIDENIHSFQLTIHQGQKETEEVLVSEFFTLEMLL